VQLIGKEKGYFRKYRPTPEKARSVAVKARNMAFRS